MKMSEEHSNGLKLLLDYSSSESDCEDISPSKSRLINKEPQTVSKKKLPLPQDLLTQLVKPHQVIDDPNLHQGRIRTFPHERGNWTTLIYIPLNRNVSRLFEMIKCDLEMMGLRIDSIQDPHVSLTKTLVIPHHWIESLVDTVTKNVQHVPRFRVQLNSVEMFCNEEKSRTFIAVGANDNKSKLLELVTLIDKSVVEFKLPTYYEEPNFHASIAWCINDETSLISSRQSELNTILQHFKSKYDGLSIDVTHLVMKTGNRFYSFPLR